MKRPKPKSPPQGHSQQPGSKNIARLIETADTLSLYCELRRALGAVDSMMTGMLTSTDRHGRLQVIAGQLQTAREVAKRWIEAEEVLLK